MSSHQQLLPLMTALYHTEECWPIFTFPITAADGATKRHFIFGVCDLRANLRRDGCTLYGNISKGNCKEQRHVQRTSFNVRIFLKHYSHFI